MIRRIESERTHSHLYQSKRRSDHARIQIDSVPLRGLAQSFGRIGSSSQSSMDPVEITPTQIGLIRVMYSVEAERLRQRHHITKERSQRNQRLLRDRRPIPLVE